jgi:SNF2 family DNA or RNA helicase
MEFQLVGVVNAVNILNFYNGVILADSVGLGKSFMASAVVEEFISGKHPNWYANDEKEPSVVLILPPSVISQWEELLIGEISEDVRARLCSGEKVNVDSEYFMTNRLKKVIKSYGNNKIYEIYDESGGNLLGTISFLSLGIFQNMKEGELKQLAEDYDLFVVDEAHKYRNRSTKRFNAVQKLQTKNDGFKNKFLLLTATPLNNSVNDIFNLVRLFSDDTFAPFRMKGVDINDLMKQYRDLKKNLDRTDDDKTRKDLKKVAAEIKKKVLDEVMVLRTRKYILEQFKDLKVNGKPLVFKDPQPYSLNYSPFYTKDYHELIKLISEKLNQILFEYTKLYGSRYVVFEEQGFDQEEDGPNYIEIADLFKLLLGKRLESGIYPFETTLRRIHKKEKIFYEHFTKQIDVILNEDNLIDAVKEAIEKAKIKKDLDAALEEYNIEEEYEETWFDRVVKILLEYAEGLREDGINYTYFECIKLGMGKVLENLEADLRIMDEILGKLDELKNGERGDFKTFGNVPKTDDDIISLPIYCCSHDPKLDALKQILGHPSLKSDKLDDVVSLNGKKIIIFTQYRDTAYYLYHNIMDWVKREIDLHTWLFDNADRVKLRMVTGDTEMPTKISYMKRFAPSDNSGFDEVEKLGEIEILISTDALSEGVNLQDADAVIDYDLPWNPMVIVQRVGRVNRIGNEKDVHVVNFIPSDEIEVIVGVLSKLKEKIQDITYVVGKETRILSPDEEVSVETFGEKIRDISTSSMAKLEGYGVSDDFKNIIPEGIPEEQLDEYRLLNAIQYDYEYTYEDFDDVKNMDGGSYYSFIHLSGAGIRF